MTFKGLSAFYNNRKRAQILHHVDRIHKAGIELDELEPRHVLSDGHSLRIIDFTDVLPHTCRSKYDYLTAPEVVPDLQELAPALKCPSLYSFAFEMGFWTIRVSFLLLAVP
jgi:hypothetical protein